MEYDLLFVWYLLGDATKGSGFVGLLVLQFQAATLYSCLEDCAALFDVVYLAGTEFEKL